MNCFRSLVWLGLKYFLLPALPLAFPCRAQNYQQPPREVLDILHAPNTPQVSLSPTRDRLLLIEEGRYPSIQELARPMLPLAGLRINPQNNGLHASPQNTGITIQTLPEGRQTRVELPPGARFGFPVWAPDGKRFALAMHGPTRIELWLVDALSGQARKVDGMALNATAGAPFQWMPGSRGLLCRTVPSDRGPAPVTPAAPIGPNIQESYGKSAPVRTHQDLLKTAHDEALCEYYCTAQLVLVDAGDCRLTKLGQPALYGTVDPAPGGTYYLVSILRKPFSRLLTMAGFARDVLVWDRQGNTVYELARLPSQEGVPIEGVPTGPRRYHWRPTAEATLVWAEALDGGDPRTKAPHRDRLAWLKAPFTGQATELLRIEQRFMDLTWGETEGIALVTDYDRERRWRRTLLIRADEPVVPRVVWDRSARDRYRDPGDPLLRTLSNGERVLWQAGNSIFLAGTGASPRGDFPFLDRLDLTTLKAERLFQCDDHSYETVVALLEDGDSAGLRFITRHETQRTPPNYRLRAIGNFKPVDLTHFADPTPQLRRVTKRLVTYQRNDGVPLSFTLYLPADYQPGTRLPTVVWAYPREYNDPETAGQVAGSTNRFTTLSASSHLFFLMQGYAVLDNATMPIVGPPDTMNDTFIEQIIASAQAAIDKAVELGVTDPDRVGVGGHSYGAFMTANLLAHSRLFRAGIARSGAYNRTLTPFGFQGERRPFWEAPGTYNRLSPFTFAHQIKDPLLLIHGEADDNDGTFPIQSQRLFQAIKGNGGDVRYVTLPFEAHSYAASQSIEHTLYEMITWFDTHVKNAPPKARALGTGL